MQLVGPALVGQKGHEGMETIGTVHVAHWVPFEGNHIGFWTVYDGDMEKYIQDFAEEISVVFDKVFPQVEGGPPTPVAQHPQAFYQWALDNNYPPIGFYSAYPGLSVLDIRALLRTAKRSRRAVDSEASENDELNQLVAHVFSL